jgi:putative ABC transport system permease protein
MSVHNLMQVTVDWRVRAFTTAIAVLTGLLFGLAPAIQTSAGRVHDVLKEGGRGVSGGSRARGALVVAEISLAVVLLAAATLMARSLAQLQKVDLGFRPAHTLTAQISLPGGRYTNDTTRVRFFRDLEQRLAAMPGVQSVGSTSFLPLTGQRSASGFNVEGQPKAERGTEPIGDMRAVTPGYFAAMGIPILDGRGLTVDDRENSPSVAVVSQRLAHTFWPGESAVGHYLLYDWFTAERVRIVGVAENVRHGGVDAEPYMEIYRPLGQMPYSTMSVVIRGTGDPAAYAAPLRNAVRQMDPMLAVGSVQTMGELVSHSLNKSQLSTALFGTFGLLGLLLAGIGIYGVMSYTVQQRAREMGIRLALGAQPRSVLGLVLGRGMGLAVIGVVVGTAGALATTRLMRSLLFEVAPADHVTFALVPLVLILIALAAAYVPGRRATRLDVVEVLRAE